MSKNTKPTTQATPPIDQVKKVKVRLVKDAYDEYKIGGQTNSNITLSPELAERMIASGHAELIK